MINNIYQPYITRIPMLTSEILIRHVELLDNRTSEFQHSHNSYEIYYSIEGNLRINVSGHIISVPTGHLLLLPPHTWHGTIYEPDVQRKYFIIIFELPENLTKNIGTNYAEFETSDIQRIFSNVKEGKYYVARDDTNCCNIIKKISTELNDKKFGWQLNIRSLYLSFIILAMRNLIPETYAEVDENSQNVNLAIKISKYMHANYNKDISLQSVAKAMYVTTRHVNRVFEACFATTFSKTLSIFRLNYAKDYLFKTDYSVDKIANLVGFSSSRTLLKLFHEVEGITTTQYRKMVRKSKINE
ncbi:AraC family transcriptional regulator [Clostridium sp. JS66]|uniref:AraC family transcriptional regulator n=1 Tax=Clostridium sp. JS66 TaxID=3064705 RepID=UPI00298E6B2E|nr:AraC family transcriptional regulator [Clostridium sp. JS66]WPC43272.1 AraC family transcriptional regulator [Clostridium sp. JS66]